MWNEEIEEELHEQPSVMELTVTSEENGTRLDSFLSRDGLTRSAAAKRIEQGFVTVNGKTVGKNTKLKSGDAVVCVLPEPEPCEAQPENIPLNVIYEDDDIIVINKPCGMVVHPAPGNPSGTLVNALLYHCGESLSGIGGVIRPGIVHRIDKDTAGLLVCAKNDAAHLHLSEQIKEHRVSRIYHAILLGNLREDRGTVNAPIGRHPVDRKRMAVIRGEDKHARHAVTHWEVLERFGQFTHVRCELETGRTHQIRVHMASIGHPLLGDMVYGGGGTHFEARHKSSIHGQCLFAAELRLTHPTSGKLMIFSADLPDDFSHVLDILRMSEN